MRRKRRTFSRDFKLETVRHLQTSRTSVNAVSRELDIGADVLRRWRRELDGPRVELVGRGRALPSDDEELRRLRRENAVLREEREILKKAMAFFAKDVR